LTNFVLRRSDSPSGSLSVHSVHKEGGRLKRVLICLNNGLPSLEGIVYAYQK